MAVTINGTTGILAPDIGIDGTTLTVDAVNNRIGIATSSPNAKLQIVTTSGARALTVTAPTLGPYITFETNTTPFADIGSEAGLTGSGSNTEMLTLNARGSRSLSFRTNSNERLRITSAGNIGVGGLTTPGALLSIPAGESNTPRFAIESAVDNNDFTITQYEDGNGTYTMLGQNVKLNSGGNNTILDSGHRTAGILLDARNHGAISFLTGAANAATENVKIDSSGRMLLGTTTEGEANADNLTVATSGHTGMTIRSGTANRGNIYFSDGTSGDAEYRGYITYDHDGDKLKLGTSNADRLLITSDGTILAGGQSSQFGGAFRNLELRNDSTTVGGSMTLVNDQSATAGATCQIDCYQNYRSAGKIIFGRENANNWQAAAGGAYSFLAFHTTSAGTEAERLRIHAGGELSLGTPSVIGRYTFYNSGSSGSDAPSGGDKGMYVKSDMGPTHVDLTGVDNYTMQISNGAYAGTGISNPQGTITKLLFHGTTYNGWNSYGAICMDNQGASGYRGDFVFIAGGSERLRIKSNGQVNIGAALPSSSAGTFNVKPASGDDSYFKIRPASEFDGAITGTAIDIRNSSNGASQHLVFRAQEFRFWCDNSDKVRINSEGYYTSGNLTISGRANYGNDTIATYSQVLSDNHANTFFGQNLKLGVSGTSGNHTLKIINQHASIGGAGMLIGGNGSGRQNTINFYAESANQAPATDVTANAKMTLNTNGQLTTMGEQRIRYHTGSTSNKTSKVTTALGTSGTYSTCTVTITTHSYCTVAYDILVGGYSAAHCHRAGTYYINGQIYGSYTSISNVGGSVGAAGPIYVATQKARWTFTKSNGFVHPICSVTVASGGDGYINHGDVSIVWS